MPEEKDSPSFVAYAAEGATLPKKDAVLARQRRADTIRARRAGAPGRRATAVGQLEIVSQGPEAELNAFYTKLLDRTYREIQMNLDDDPDHFTDKMRAETIASNSNLREGFLARMRRLPEASHLTPTELLMIGITEGLSNDELQKIVDTDPKLVEPDERHDPRFYANYYLEQRQKANPTA